jgi:hypothetical protein
VSRDLHGDALFDPPGDTPRDPPGEAPFDPPGDTPREPPGDTPWESPGDVSPDVPGDVLPDTPGGVLPDAPGGGSPRPVPSFAVPDHGPPADGGPAEPEPLENGPSRSDDPAGGSTRGEGAPDGTGPASPEVPGWPGAAPPSESDPPDCGGQSGDPDIPFEPRTGPGEAGGRKGMSIVSVVPSASSFEPAVMAAKVGTDARPTRRATISTYRRVGPEKPESARYTPFSRFRMTLSGGAASSSGSSGTAGSPPCAQ